MFTLRTLSVRDVALAMKRRELGLALRISENLCSNAANSVSFHVHKHLRQLSRAFPRRPS